jgi:hypothetical protein
MAQNNIFGEIIQSIAPQQNLRDWQHATRTFVDGLYRLAPKYSNLFHVYIDLDTNISNITDPSVREIGLMAKSVQLPRVTVHTKTYNAYNRKMVQQERVSYEPVSITFHDDSADVVRTFWNNYFNFYYRDSDYKDLQTYQNDSKYNDRQEQLWGFTPRKENSNRPYIQSIRIYSLHQKRFSAYTLVRPVIAAYQPGTHTAGEYTAMEQSISVNYEAIQYDSGPVSNNTVLGFDQGHYDTTDSPLRNLGALIGAGTNILHNIENGDLGSLVQNGINATNILSGQNRPLVQSPSLDLSQVGSSILRGQNPFSPVFAPTSATVAQGIQRAANNNVIF